MDKNVNYDKPILAFIVPFYNEEEIILKSLTIFYNKLISLNNIINNKSFIIFVNDGSTDNSKNLLKSNIKNNTVIISLSKNKGHQNALLAGMEYAKDKCDFAISIDCDLEQDINKVDEFIEHFKNGSEIVFGVRENRNSDNLFKKLSAISFYKIMKFFGVNIIENHADYRLLSNRALNLISSYREVNLFLRGMFLELGLKHSIVYFKVSKRDAGKSKYTLKKMLSLALNGITSFSLTPLRLVSLLGFIISFVSALFVIYGIAMAIFSSSVVPGWASTIVPIYFLGGLQIFSLGIIGEYIGKIYLETKSRPRYLIKDIIEKF
ncbi:glycosyltransferase [Helicobacter sp. MIT 14-3879]|nr:glycosyltransferase [Helicobacter sp. MIT 14-3879]